MRIIAHRGASGYAPENTLASFKKALEMGSKEIELDVQMTKDGQLVVIHDYFLERTTNGRGMIMSVDYDYIKNLDAGSWFGPEYKGEKVPLLSDVIDLCKEENQRQKGESSIILHIEIKKTKLEKRPIEEKVLDLVNKKDYQEHVLFSSFQHSCLKSLVALQKVKIGVLMGSEMLQSTNYLKKNGIFGYSINQSAEFIDQVLVDEAHAAGLKVLSYTVNRKDLALYFQTLGVDGIFCNYPDLLE